MDEVKKLWIETINKQLDEVIASIIIADIDRIREQSEEIERLNNVINELEKWLDKEINQLKLEDNYESADTLEIVQEELQELKGSDKE